MIEYLKLGYVIPDRLRAKHVIATSIVIVPRTSGEYKIPAPTSTQPAFHLHSDLANDMGQPATSSANTESLTVTDNRTGKSYSIPSDLTRSVPCGHGLKCCL